MTTNNPTIRNKYPTNYKIIKKPTRKHKCSPTKTKIQPQHINLNIYTAYHAGRPGVQFPEGEPCNINLSLGVIYIYKNINNKHPTKANSHLTKH